MQVEIKSPIPSVLDTAKRVGVSSKRASQLAEYARTIASKANGRVVRADRKTPKSANALTANIPGNKSVKFRPVSRKKK
jgi:hypothetical protein